MDCELKRIDDLPYDFELGACGTFLFEDRVFTEERVMLCFSFSGKNFCFR